MTITTTICRVITRLRSAAGLLSTLAALTMLGAPPASADEPTAKEPPKVELVLDVSGSMRAADIGGRSRISVAQQSFGEVVDALPAETQLGIRVLGASYPGTSKVLGCQDSQQIVPVGPVDRVEAKTAIATLRPTGWTPVGLALREAAKDLGTGETTRRIVLITDGEDTCSPPDPCEVARELAAQGTHLVVDTLGLTLDDKVRRQLTCIAAATGGTVHGGSDQAGADRPDQPAGATGPARPTTRHRCRWPAPTSAPPPRCSPPVSTPTASSSPSTAGTGCRSAGSGTARLGQRRARPGAQPRLRGAAARRRQ